MMSKHPKSRWLKIVGIGEEGIEGLTPAARTMIESAEVLIGGNRHLSMLPDDDRERIIWPSPIKLLTKKLRQYENRDVCILATGDPMCFGIGSTLIKSFSKKEILILPAPSALTLACARMGWPENEVELLTVHGRPLGMLEPFLQPHSKLIILSNDASTPSKVAVFLTERGYENSLLTVLEHMGGKLENNSAGKAGTWAHKSGAALNTLAVELIPGPKARHLSRSPGLMDDAFINDGKLTKREVRAITLSALAPTPNQTLWDVGAGSGAVSIEWMRFHSSCKAISIEPRPDRRLMIAENAARLGVPFLQVIAGQAPDILHGLLRPDAIFIGGGVTAPGVVDTCWLYLKPGGRLVSNVVTLEGEQLLGSQHKKYGGNLIRIAVSRAESLGPYRGWRPSMTVTQWSVQKSFSASEMN